MWGVLFTVMGKIGKGSRLHWVGWLLFLRGGKIAGGREWRPLFGLCWSDMHAGLRGDVHHHLVV